MDDAQNARSRYGALYRVFRCFGREFPVYYQYSAEDGNTIPNYPDFDASPQYTDDGRPFSLVSQEGCAFAEPDASNEGPSIECGSCRHFRTEEGFSLFGVCMNDRKRRPQTGTGESK